MNDFIKRIGLLKYPEKPYYILELPCRVMGKKYQVWTGKRWYKLEMREIKQPMSKIRPKRITN